MSSLATQQRKCLPLRTGKSSVAVWQRSHRPVSEISMGPVRSAFRSLAVHRFCTCSDPAPACGGNDGGSAPTGPSGTGMAIVAGNFQLAKYGTPVPVAPAVKVTGANGPVAGVQVTFAPVAGSGSVTGGYNHDGRKWRGDGRQLDPERRPGRQHAEGHCRCPDREHLGDRRSRRPRRDHGEVGQRPEWRRALRSLSRCRWR